MDGKAPLAASLLLLFLAVACAPEQLRAVRRFNEQAELLQVACFDINGDAAVDAADADPAQLPDLTGDALVDDNDLGVISDSNLVLPNGRPPECEGGDGPVPDWQVSEPPALDCQAGDRGLLLLAVGGGAVDLATLHNAAGARWMVEEIAAELEVPTQIASVAPGLNGTAEPQPDAEDWTFNYLSRRLESQPCLKLSIVGHSHGGVLATAVVSRLEDVGLKDQVLLTALVDRATNVYFGDTQSIPQASPVFNVWLPAADQEIAGHEILQPNVENFSAEGLEAPADGEDGGPAEGVNHTTIDNSEDVLDEVRTRIDFLTRAPDW